MHDAFASPKQNRPRLLLRGLRFDEAHLGALGRDDDRLGVGGIVLLALHERPNILRGDQLDLVAELDQFPRPVVGAAAGLHHYHSRRLAPP